jgi:uncharacterized protein (TIGR00251 family)
MAEKIYTLKVIPNSSQNKIVAATDNYLKIKIKAPAHKGEANAALIEFLSTHFRLAKNKIILMSGKKSPSKRIKIKD